MHLFPFTNNFIFETKKSTAIKLNKEQIMDPKEYKKFDMIALAVGVAIVLYALIMAFFF